MCSATNQQVQGYQSLRSHSNRESIIISLVQPLLTKQPTSGNFASSYPVLTFFSSEVNLTDLSNVRFN